MDGGHKAVGVDGGGEDYAGRLRGNPWCSKVSRVGLVGADIDVITHATRLPALVGGEVIGGGQDGITPGIDGRAAGQEGVG